MNKPPSAEVNPVASGKLQSWQVATVCFALIAITFAVFGQTGRFDFLNYDDDQYVYENPVVAQGLTAKGVWWALTFGGIGHWHPLTWLTHMADCELYGLHAGRHHLTNVILHALAAVLLFMAVTVLTRSQWRAAFVAAVFAIHPLRVESVAWIAERKDVLSGVFFMLALWAYALYARQPSMRRSTVVAVCHGLGLLCKNTLVTLPFVFLLLDWWPLRRLKFDGTWKGLVKEKLPLFLLSAGSCVATFLVPEKIHDSDRLPLLECLANAVVSYAVYLRQMVFPSGLAVPYPNLPHGPPIGTVILVFILLAAISAIVILCRNERPYLVVGWFWYLGMMVPMIGIIQISNYAHADRYTYLPGIGLIMAGTWAVGDWSMGWKNRRIILGGLMSAVIGALMICAWIQTGYWKNNETLWPHSLACTKGNNVAHYNLGFAYDHEGRVDDALAEYRSALQIKPSSVDVYLAMGNIFLKRGQLDDAISCYQKALQYDPDNPVTQGNLGIALRHTGRTNEAISHFEAAQQLAPASAQTHANLGMALFQQGKFDDAVDQFQSAVRINPNDAGSHYYLGRLLARKGEHADAIAEYQRALKIEPANAEFQNNLAWLLVMSPQARLRDGATALQLARQACAISEEKNPFYLRTLAAAFAEVGQFSEARDSVQKAIKLAHQSGKGDLEGRLEAELKQYEAGLPIHQ